MKTLLVIFLFFVSPFILFGQTAQSYLAKIKNLAQEVASTEKSLVDNIKVETWFREIDKKLGQDRALSEGNEVLRTLKREIGENMKALSKAPWLVDSSLIGLEVGDFDEKAQEWTISLKSLDPLIPFETSFAYSIAKSANKKSAQDLFEKARGSNELALRLELVFAERSRFNPAIVEARIKLALNEKNIKSSPLINLTQKMSRLDLVEVEGGTFDMGSEEHLASRPVHPVTLSTYLVSRTEITQAVYTAVMKSNPSQVVGDYLPVNYVNWYQAVEFCNKLSELEGLSPVYTIVKGKKDVDSTDKFDYTKWLVTLNQSAKGYRLPTEAEWEFACRGGNLSKGYKYSGSNEIVDVSWYSSGAGIDMADVGLKKPNELGIFDMSGNVSEWCYDWYSRTYEDKPAINPIGQKSNSIKVVRGGNFIHPDQAGSYFARDYNNRYIGYPYLGFRVVRSRK